ncbi:MAG: TonB-dependent receptor domain-containing protein [Solirubrobacterales bacterium]
MNTHRHRGAAFFVSALLASTVSAGEGGGGLVGWVENTHGTPVAGALISVFGKGVGTTGLVTLTDSAGQFMLPHLPAGSYTLRALGSGHVPSPAQKFTVLPNRDATFTLSLTPVAESVPEEKPLAAESPDAEPLREWRWLLRHKRRSALEDRDDETPLPAGALEVADAPSLRQPTLRLADLGGSVEFITMPLGALSPADVNGAGQGALRLRGRLAEGVQWNLGGLVTESQGTSWRMAAEFVLEPGGGHTIETGAGYGMGLARRFGSVDEPLNDTRGVGAMFARTRINVASNVTASVGGRYSYLGFLADPNHLDTMVALEFRGAPGTVIRASASSRTLAPGGDLLTLSTRDSSPLISYAALTDTLRASKTTSYELAVDRTVGPTTIGARAFYEDTADQLVNVLEGYPATRSLHMFNGGPLAVHGVAVTLGHHFGDAVSGSVTYSYGQARRTGLLVGDGMVGMELASASFRQTHFHDLEAQLETFIDLTDTRLQAFCRINALNPQSEGSVGNGSFANTRFDIQLTQGLPFLQPLTRADWEVLVGVRNLFYERGEGGMFDEMVVLHSPKRVVGGIAVHF